MRSRRSTAFCSSSLFSCLSSCRCLIGSCNTVTGEDEDRADANSLIIASSKKVELPVSACLLFCDGEALFAASADDNLEIAVVGLSAIKGFASCCTEEDDCTLE